MSTSLPRGGIHRYRFQDRSIALATVAEPQELAEHYAAAWNTIDATERRRLLDAACSPGVRFLQQGMDDEVVGVDALDAFIASFQAGWPDGVDVRVELTTPVDAHHGVGRGGFVWIFGDDRGYGTDFAQLGPDGKMALIAVFGDAAPPTTNTATDAITNAT